ncbi:hypothetical protein NPIL_70251 [Nephila pilipes]|uniref:Uncharacterized protein n=1 Tax=Nephila pilipes TaxID=299642 RepID=A0A8X6IPQ1_NEPPI|nr:hypothetical protein NPIL_70251 [Nephila pilipes]
MIVPEHQNPLKRGFYTAMIQDTGGLGIARFPIAEDGLLLTGDQNLRTSVRVFAVPPERVDQLYGDLTSPSITATVCKVVFSSKSDCPAIFQ